MSRRSVRRYRVSAALAAALTSILILWPGGLPAASASVPTAHTVTSIQAVGALFRPAIAGTNPGTTIPHYCTASIVHSTTHDLVLTAAHCVSGTGATIEFAPGFHDGISPYGVWQVRRAYVDAYWKNNLDPRHDVAILKVASASDTPTRHIEDVAGSNVLSTEPLAGHLITVDGYVAGAGGRPITCRNVVYYTSGYPSFACNGYSGGVSGGPWFTLGRIHGVIGGLHQGGCSPSVSYSAPFGSQVAALLARAEAGGTGDIVPLAGSDGC